MPLRGSDNDNIRHLYRAAMEANRGVAPLQRPVPEPNPEPAIRPGSPAVPVSAAGAQFASAPSRRLDMELYMLMAKDLRSRGLLPKGTLTGPQISDIFHNLVEQRNEHACRWHDLIKKL